MPTPRAVRATAAQPPTFSAARASEKTRIFLKLPFLSGYEFVRDSAALARALRLPDLAPFQAVGQHREHAAERRPAVHSRDVAADQRALELLRRGEGDSGPHQRITGERERDVH